MPVSFFPVMFLARRSRQPPPLYGLRGAAGWRAHARLARRAHPLLATLPETGGRATPAHLPWWGVPWWGVPWWGVPRWGVPVWGVPWWGVPWWGVPWWGVAWWGVTWWGFPWWGVPWWGLP